MINFFGKKKETAGSVSEAMLDPNNSPRHVAIIMDGNGRWAKRKGLPRSYGHRAGADTLKRIVVAADDLGIKVLTVYAFSTENWKRPDEEVSYIMKLMKSYLSKNLLELKDTSTRVAGLEGLVTIKGEKAVADLTAAMADDFAMWLGRSLPVE